MPVSFREKIYSIIDNEEESTLASQLFDSLIMMLIILSILSIVAESFEGLHRQYSQEFEWFEWGTIIVFTIEYVLRILTADIKYRKQQRSQVDSMLAFMTSSSGIVDLVAFLPFYLPLILPVDLRFIRIIKITRLLRVFKLGKLTNSISMVGKVFSEKKSELGITLFVTFILLLVSSTIMFNIEHAHQPEQFPNIIATFWWAIATLTTVGYGDVYPVTGWGKLISGLIAVLGIGLVALPTGIISSAFIEQIESDEEIENNEESLVSIEDSKHQACQTRFGEAFLYCPYCGDKLNADLKHPECVDT